MDLIADIGATNTRAALLDDEGNIVATAAYLNTEHPELSSVLLGFLSQHADGATPQRTALAIAAPLAGDQVTMTNIGWQFSQSELKSVLGTGTLTLLNDFEALALALPQLTARDCFSIGTGQALPGAAMAVLGPGSGLGVASVVVDNNQWVAIRGEGGHVSLPALDDTEAAVIAEHRDTSGHCSAETLLSGPGLVRIYTSVCRMRNRTIEPCDPADVTALAEAGDKDAVRSFDVFFAMLGTVAGNLALTVGARGGVFIGGGIVPRVTQLIGKSNFRERFVAKGRYRDYLNAIPTAVISCDNPAFIGLKASLGKF